MKIRYIARAVLATMLLALLAAPLAAQSTSTTLAAALTNASDQNMVIASATGWTATSTSAVTFALIDREVVGVRALTGTNVSITRGLFSTRATGHPNGTKVYFIPAGSLALTSRDRAGACTTAGSADESQNASIVPVLNPSSGHAYTCLNSTWVPISNLMGAATCTVTQATSKSTGVTCQGVNGTITMNAAGLATVTSVAFTVTDAHVAAGDTVAVSLKSGNTANSYQVGVDAVAAGSFVVSLRNYTGGTLSEAVVLNFAVTKAY
jgi:hypothetical protein